MVDARKLRRKKQQDLRVETIQVLLNSEEKEEIIEQAQAEGMKVSAWIRWRLRKKNNS